MIAASSNAELPMVVVRTRRTNREKTEYMERLDNEKEKREIEEAMTAAALETSVQASAQGSNQTFNFGTSSSEKEQ